MKEKQPESQQASNTTLMYRNDNINKNNNNNIYDGKVLVKLV